ncbi:formate dehydrogenase accessory sulfurtransferase FdhD [Colwellia asteriadis]|uniref:Formate dehydrogenase accessory sulfurtransferase FdhD n=1 Tax=Colwellia asteriadis TaxID=517723 RepID=A0ABN1L4P2_9GAMM
MSQLKQTVTTATTLPAQEKEVSLAQAQLCEIALAVCINGISQSVMMVSDNNLEDFALGFALSEGFIENISEVTDIIIEPLSLGKQVNLIVSARAEHRLKKRRRTLAGPTGCGLCGLESINEAMLLTTLNASNKNTTAVSTTKTSKLANIPNEQTIINARSCLNELQQQHHGIRGNHCAAYFDLLGKPLAYREDVGRHSALDKLIGCLAQANTYQQGFIILSSRCSHDLVAKAARAGILTLVTLAQPTNLAVNSAQQTGLVLFSFCNRQLKRFA